MHGQTRKAKRAVRAWRQDEIDPANSDEELIAQTEWQQAEKKKQQAQEPYVPAVATMFAFQAEQVREAIFGGNFVLPDEGGGEPLTVDAVFDLEQATETMKGVLRGNPDLLPEPLRQDLEDEDLLEDHALRIIQEGFETANERLGETIPFDPTLPIVQETVSRLERHAEGISQTTFDEIGKVIREGTEDASKGVNDIADDVAKRVEEMGNTDVDGSRAVRIARTGTTTAFESGQQASFEEAGMVGKMWLSQRDAAVRTGHLEADGQTARIDDPFRVACKSGGGREELMFPGDPTGSPCNVINCRCTSLPIPDEETFQEMQDEEPDLSNLPQLSKES